MDWNKILKVIFFWFVPGAFILWLIYRAVWVLSIFVGTGVAFTGTNIKFYSAWVHSPLWESPKDISTWATGFEKFWLIPVLLVRPSFYEGTFGPRIT